LRFEHQHVVTRFSELMRGAQARKARTHHDYPSRRPATPDDLRFPGLRKKVP